jgi:DNA-binding NarL/FixJ family response regulator
MVSSSAAGRGATPTAPIPVAVVAGDPLTGQGTVAYLKTRPEVNVLGAERQHEADVVLIIVDTITEETLKIMGAFASRSRRGDVRFVLIGDGMREEHATRAVRHGLVSVVSRRKTDFGQILRTIMDVHEGRVELPGDAVGWLAEQLRWVQKDVLEPHGLTASGFSDREIEILRMLADGTDTAEIAQRLSYSERTIKNTIYAMQARLGLRNRTHAVAFAIRNNVV